LGIPGEPNSDAFTGSSNFQLNLESILKTQRKDMIWDLEDFSFFGWECFYHIDDFAYCFKAAWLVWVLLFGTISFLCIAVAAIGATIILLKRKKRRQYAEAYCEEEARYRSIA